MLVLCNGPKRAGSTLQFNLVRELLTELDAHPRVQFIDPGKWDQAIAASAADSHEWSVVKLHEVQPAMLRFATEHQRAFAVSTHRDLRDVAGSARRFWGQSWENTLRMLDLTTFRTDLQASFADVLIQPYSDLVGNPAACAVEIATHLGLEIDPATATRIASRCSSAALALAADETPQSGGAHDLLLRLWRDTPDWMQTTLRRIGVKRLALGVLSSDQSADAITMMHPSHVATDRSASGRDLLTGKEVAIIEDRYRAWLDDRGYLFSEQIFNDAP